jgi:hypothetical protein
MSIEHTQLTLETFVAFVRHLPLTSINAAAAAELWPQWRRASSKPFEKVPQNALVPIQGGLVRWLGSRVEVNKTKDNETEKNLNHAIDKLEADRAQKRADARRACRQGGCREDVLVGAFSVAKFKVSNREFLTFMLGGDKGEGVGENDESGGGYNQQRFWSQAGWAWRQAYSVTHPKWWRLVEENHDEEENRVKNGDEGKKIKIDVCDKYRFRDTLEELRMPWDWPVEVCLWEAEAFLAWKNENAHSNAHYIHDNVNVSAPKKGKGIYTLPTEAEHSLFSGIVRTIEPAFEEAVYHGSAHGSLCPYSNLNWKYLSPSAVDELPPRSTGKCMFVRI